MSNSYTITVSKSTLRIEPGKSGAASFTVTNKTGKAMTVRAEAVFVGQGESSWLTIDGEEVREFSADGTQQYLIKLSVPANAASGTYPFKLRVYSVDEPDEYFAESSVVEVTVPQVEAPKPKKKLNLMAIAVVASIFLAIVAIWLGVKLAEKESRIKDLEAEKNYYLVAEQVNYIDLNEHAKNAVWISGQIPSDENSDSTPKTKIASLDFMGKEDDRNGHARLERATMENQKEVLVLRMHPKWDSKGGRPEGTVGTIKGQFPSLYLENWKSIFFRAQVGFIDGARGTDGVTFMVWEHHKEGKTYIKKPITLPVEKTYTGVLKTITGDLSDLAGKQVAIELQVNTGATSTTDWAAWVNPQIIYIDDKSEIPDEEGNHE